MYNVIICGINGFMGRIVKNQVDASDDMRAVAGVDVTEGEMLGTPIFTNILNYTGEVDVIIDFSHPSCLESNLQYATSKKVPIVIATTGFSDEQLNSIEQASKIIPVFRTANMSLGVNLQAELSKKAAEFLGQDCEVEIIEKHHHRKLDAPSGTALLLADVISKAMPGEHDYVYGRTPESGKRSHDEIGIHAVRGGTIVGQHDVLFIRDHEVLEIRHTAESRDIFAAGAIRAAKFLMTKNNGMYSMNDVLSNKENILVDKNVALVHIHGKHRHEAIRAIRDNGVDIGSISFGYQKGAAFTISADCINQTDKILSGFIPGLSYEIKKNATLIRITGIAHDSVNDKFAELRNALPNSEIYMAYMGYDSIEICTDSKDDVNLV